MLIANLIISIFFPFEFLSRIFLWQEIILVWKLLSIQIYRTKRCKKNDHQHHLWYHLKYFEKREVKLKRIQHYHLKESSITCTAIQPMLTVSFTTLFAPTDPLITKEMENVAPWIDNLPQYVECGVCGLIRACIHVGVRMDFLSFFFSSLYLITDWGTFLTWCKSRTLYTFKEERLPFQKFVGYISKSIEVNPKVTAVSFCSVLMQILPVHSDNDFSICTTSTCS